MKNLLKLALFVFIGCCFISPKAFAQVKERRVSYAKCAYYEGPAEKKSPKGVGTMIINEEYDTKITITGTFNDTNIPDAVVDFAALNVTFKGKVSFKKKTEMLLLIPTPIIILQLSDGGFYKGDQLLGNIGDEPLTLKLDCSLGVADFDKVSGELQTINNSYKDVVEMAKIFADCSEYSFENGEVVSFSLSPRKFDINNLSSSKSSEPIALVFVNGAKVVFSDAKTGEGTWTRANGDYIEVNDAGRVAGGRLTLGTVIVADSLVTHKFDNENLYVGSVKEGLIPTDLKEVVRLKEIEWPWNKFCAFAQYGTLTYADGTEYSGLFSGKGFNGSAKLDNTAYAKGVLTDVAGNKTIMVDGVTEQEFTRRQAERKALYEKAKASDYFKFDENGNLKEFKLTYPDLTDHKFLREGDKVIKNTITYTDGMIVELSGIVGNEEYKELRELQSAPDYANNRFIGKRIYTDGLTITLGHGYINRNGYRVASMTGDWVIEEPKRDNGDYAILVGSYDSKTADQIDVMTVKKTLPDYTICYEKDQRVEYPNGNVYRGGYNLVTEGKSPLMDDERIRALRIDVISSYDNVVGFEITDGVMCDPSGKIIEIYKNGCKLDEFDFERERIQMQNKIDAERKRVEAEEAKKAAEEKFFKEFVQKHGEKNVIAAASGEIKVGMHVELLVLAVNARGWKIDLERDGGNNKIYRVHGMTMHDYGSSASIKDGTIAYVYVSGNKVTNIEWYGTVRTY